MEQNTALLAMDMQMGVIAIAPAAAGILGNVAKAIATARRNNIPVIYVVVGFRNGVPEVSETSTNPLLPAKRIFQQSTWMSL